MVNYNHPPKTSRNFDGSLYHRMGSQEGDGGNKSIGSQGDCETTPVPFSGPPCIGLFVAYL